MFAINCDFSPEGKKQCWIWLSLWTRVFKSSSLVVDKANLLALLGSVTGTLKGYDQLLNLVLDEAVESLRAISFTPPFHLDGLDYVIVQALELHFGDSDDPLKTTDQTRRLGLIVCRGTAVMLVSPTDGTDEIANPFVQPDGA
ncbi:hypothetical protein SADUNF_Sadunf09G0049900 [Salix dunnii]|uniref:Sm domain-containing protein n=1 Tax=Salix dunnii TaxID=1413687 RepID=A0A835MZT0_9ROSI|nr:hypothetical protein SADUNF_Sadunf09G0049900 [Salix dunnii]